MAVRVNPESIIGTRYGRIVAIKHESTEPRIIKGKKFGYKYHFLWRCDCGNEKVIEYRNVTDGNSRSCGCLSAELTLQRSLKHGNARATGSKRSPEYKAWVAMNDRCYCRTSSIYQFYGAKGLTVSDEWRGEDGFENFLRDMGRKPSLKHSVDRIDNSKGYSKDNCRWASPLEQASNKTNNVVVEFEGKRYTLPELIRSQGLEMGKYETYRARLKRGWSAERTVYEPA